MKVTDREGREQELTAVPEFRRCALYIPVDMWADYCAHGARWGTTPSDVARMALTAGHKATVDHSDRALARLEQADPAAAAAAQRRELVTRDPAPGDLAQRAGFAAGEIEPSGDELADQWEGAERRARAGGGP